MVETIIGSEIEVYKTSNGYMMVDLNSGKLGGAKRLGSFASVGREVNGLEEKIANVARSYTWDINEDCYIVFDTQLGIQEVDGIKYISPLIYEVKRAIEEKGYKVKGFVGRDKIFSESHDNWKTVQVSDNLEVKAISSDDGVLRDLANTEAVYFGCHFAPTSCNPNCWDEDTCRNGMINNLIDLPGINWLFMRESEFTPYKDAFMFSRGNSLNIRDESIQLVRGEEELYQKFIEMNRKGHQYAVIKDLARMSIGGRSVSFVDLSQPENYNGIPSTALVMPYFHIEPTLIGDRKFVLQTRMIYSSVQKSEPDFVFAKVYPGNGANSKPSNLSSVCADFVVWDLQDGMYHLTSLEKGKLSVSVSSYEEQVALREHFESVVETIFPEIKKVERKLQEIGTDYGQLFHFYKRMKKQKLVPGNIHPFLNLFMRR
ncbi:MAG: hypothetical protein ABIH82_03905 [Candidatus Woesearchaeota archaeon]